MVHIGNSGLDMLKRAVSWWRIHWWDWLHGVRTCGNVLPSEMVVSPSASQSLQHAILYMPTHPMLIADILRNLPLEPGRYELVDFGSGKGRVLLAASQYPLRRITGVEFDHRLHAIAVENIRRFRGGRRCHDVRALCMDALEYELPTDDAIYFFYFPFREPVMRRVVERIRRSLEQHPRDVFLVYVNPEAAHLVEATALFDLYRTNRYYKIWRVSATVRSPGPPPQT